jgi:hypothetical protein
MAKRGSVTGVLAAVPVAGAILIARLKHNRTTAATNHTKNHRVKLFSISFLL